MNDSQADLPYSVPPSLEPGLSRVFDYWRGLRRGQADIPFTDDVSLGALSDSGVDLILVDVFEKPLRFRIAVAGRGIEPRYGSPVEGVFADELAPEVPLNYFLSQCGASIEGRVPTFYRHARRPFYARLLLPLWGDGHINGVLGAVTYDAP